MFSPLLTQLQSLISSRFLGPNFIPCLAFWFFNATVLYFLNAPFHDYVVSNASQSTGIPVLVIAVALTGIAFFAYAVSALLPTFQLFFEGNWPPWIAAFFAPAQAVSYERLEYKHAENRLRRASYGTTGAGQTQAEVWRGQLLAARTFGAALNNNAYTRHDVSARSVRRLVRLRRAARPIPVIDVTSAVAQLAMSLRVNNASAPGPDNDFALDRVHQSLLLLIAYADDFVAAEDRSLVTQKQFSFGAMPLAPTRMGNVAKTIQAYAVDRYNFNFDLLWSRLQLSAQRDKDFGPKLEAAKTQFDFFISCSVLTFAATLFWITWLPLTGGPSELFVAVATIGPAVGYVWYRVAVAQYRTLADLLRGAVDLFRLDLLTSLRYPIPDSVEAERDLWEKIDAMHLRYERSDLKLAPPKS